jgi:hypothetical protein
MSDKYNGWTNYATWGVALVMDNQNGIPQHWQERVTGLKRIAETCKGEVWTCAEYVKFTLADEIKEHVEEILEHDGGDGDEYRKLMFLQCIQAALSDVNWQEIADHYIDE